MATDSLNLYTNNPTAGATDGTVISLAGDLSSPLSFVLDATQNESQIATVAIRTESGYKTAADTVIFDSSDTGDRWKLSLDGENWSDSITITDTISNFNVLFYVKASSSAEEKVSNDTSVTLSVSTKIIASTVG